MRTNPSSVASIPELNKYIGSIVKPKVRSFSIGTHWLCEGDWRLDATFYADEATIAYRILKESGFKIEQLANVATRIFWPPRFKRIYSKNTKEGYPFLQASEVLMFRLPRERWLLPSSISNAEEYFVKEGWILMTRSGTVGRCVLVSRRLVEFFLSEDLIRIIPKLPAGGYLYAYLSSWIGQTLMVREQYGKTVTHLEPQHLARLPVPLLPDNEQQMIHERIMQAYSLRDEANDLLDQAEELLHAELGLPRFDESQVPYLQLPQSDRLNLYRHPLKAFTVYASELAERLDASFHIPIAKAAVEQLRKGKYPLVRLGEVADCIIPPRFRRIYVSPEYGVPFLQGSHIPMMKPYDLKYLSRCAHADLSKWIIHEGWVLVTCSGTIGRIALVTKTWDNWAASQHIERIIPKRGRAHAGYLAAFLMSPYGQLQLKSKIYGGVVDELTEDDTASIYLPDPPLEVQERIGTLVVDAFEKKEEANKLEDEAIRWLEQRLLKAATS